MKDYLFGRGMTKFEQTNKTISKDKVSAAITAAKENASEIKTSSYALGKAVASQNISYV